MFTFRASMVSQFAIVTWLVAAMSWAPAGSPAGRAYGYSGGGAIDADGQIVVSSWATTLVPNNTRYGLVRDLAGRTTTRVSGGSGDHQSNAYRYRTLMNAHDRHVMFQPYAGRPLNGTTSARSATTVSGPETAAAPVRWTLARNRAPHPVREAFHITAPYVKLATPRAGADYPLCSLMPITWRHNLGPSERMNVEVSHDAGATWRAVAVELPNVGANQTTIWDFVIGPETRTGMVRVSWAKNGRITAAVGNLRLGRTANYVCED